MRWLAKYWAQEDLNRGPVDHEEPGDPFLPPLIGSVVGCLMDATSFLERSELIRKRRTFGGNNEAGIPE